MDRSQNSRSIKFSSLIFAFASIFLLVVSVIGFVANQSPINENQTEQSTMVIDPVLVKQIAGSMPRNLFTTRGSVDQDCWIHGLYDQGILGICTNLTTREFSFRLYEYSGMPRDEVYYAPHTREYWSLSGKPTFDEVGLPSELAGLTKNPVQELDQSQVSFGDTNAFTWGFKVPSAGLYIFKERGDTWLTQPTYYVSVDGEGKVVDALASYLPLGLMSQATDEYIYIATERGFVTYNSSTGNLSWSSIQYSDQLNQLNNRLPETCTYQLVGQLVVNRTVVISEKAIEHLLLDVVRLNDGRLVAFGKGYVAEYTHVTVHPFVLDERLDLPAGVFQQVVSERYYTVESQHGTYLLEYDEYLPSSFMQDICKPSLSPDVEIESIFPPIGA